MSEVLRISGQFVKDYNQADPDAPFGKVPYYLGELGKYGLDESDGKDMLVSALESATGAIRRDAHASVGDAVSRKELSVRTALAKKTTA